MTTDDPKALLATASKTAWKKVAPRKRAGLLVPLFSVHSRNSTGIGDLADLKFLIDWCAKTGNSILQLLPMNEVGSTSCPYDAISSFAIEPAYISLAALPEAKGKAFAARIAGLKKAFAGKGPFVDYRIKGEKVKLLWELYCAADPSPRDMKRFVDRNGYWLNDFALYKVLKYYQQGMAWYAWDEPYRTRDTRALATFAAEHAKEISFQQWVQWRAAEQFKEAKAYAASQKVLLKGDLPILISRDSADVWVHPGFFKLQYAAGAPPDMYCAKGQRWGMPTYDWPAIAADDYRYVKEKLAYAENFYDILRVDHVVGLFRIWSIPVDDASENEGLNGVFDPADEKVWEAHGKNILSVMLENTGMLLAAEDLGMIPPACPKVLKAFGIPGNDVQRWVKDWEKRHTFLDPEAYRLTAVNMLSTHDTTNWAAWWNDEAGTVDGALFMRKCAERGIDYEYARERLFDEARSRYGRLRWRDDVDSVDALVGALGKKAEEVKDFIDMYANTYREKEKLWEALGLYGAMREICDAAIVASALAFVLRSRSVFSIQLITDWLFAGGLVQGDPYTFRINTPGTVSAKNWSRRLPLSLEALMKSPLTKKIKTMVGASGRA